MTGHLPWHALVWRATERQRQTDRDRQTYRDGQTHRVVRQMRFD